MRAAPFPDTGLAMGRPRRVRRCLSSRRADDARRQRRRALAGATLPLPTRGEGDAERGDDADTGASAGDDDAARASRRLRHSSPPLAAKDLATVPASARGYTVLPVLVKLHKVEVRCGGASPRPSPRVFSILLLLLPRRPDAINTTIVFTATRISPRVLCLPSTAVPSSFSRHPDATHTTIIFTAPRPSPRHTPPPRGRRHHRRERAPLRHDGAAERDRHGLLLRRGGGGDGGGAPPRRAGAFSGESRHVQARLRQRDRAVRSLDAVSVPHGRRHKGTDGRRCQGRMSVRCIIVVVVRPPDESSASSSCCCSLHHRAAPT